MRPTHSILFFCKFFRAQTFTYNFVIFRSKRSNVCMSAPPLPHFHTGRGNVLGSYLQICLPALPNFLQAFAGGHACFPPLVSTVRCGSAWLALQCTSQFKIQDEYIEIWISENVFIYTLSQVEWI